MTDTCAYNVPPGASFVILLWRTAGGYVLDLDFGENLDSDINEIIYSDAGKVSAPMLEKFGFKFW